MSIEFFLSDNYKKFFLKEIKQVKRLLNVGCGDNLYPNFLREGGFDFEKTWGIDNDTTIQNSQIKFIDIDQNVFPFPSSYFDQVISIWSIEHFANDNFLQESRRVLKKNGNFIFVTPNILNPFLLIGWLLIDRKYPRYYVFNNYWRIHSLSRKNKFKVKKLCFIGPANLVKYYPNLKILNNIFWFFDRLINNRIFFWLKPNIVGVLEKQSN